MTDQKKTIEKKKRTWRKKVAKTATNSLSVQKKIKEAIAQRDLRELEGLEIAVESMKKSRELLTIDKTSVKKGGFVKTHGIDKPYEGEYTWIDDITGEIHNRVYKNKTEQEISPKYIGLLENAYKISRTNQYCFKRFWNWLWGK